MGRASLQKLTSSPAVTVGITFLAVIIIYSLFYIYPSYLSFSRTRQAIDKQTAELESLKMLFPVFARSKTLDSAQFNSRLPFPMREQIPRNELPTLTREIFDKAKHHKMIISSTALDINALKQDSQSVSMLIRLQGGLFDFRAFLIDIMAFKSFGIIKTLCINLDENRMKKFTLNITIKIKANRP